ncbi:hypothetical protein RI367_007578 [Sorochytrium milnesiophthora]
MADMEQAQTAERQPEQSPELQQTEQQQQQSDAVPSSHGLPAEQTPGSWETAKHEENAQYTTVLAPSTIEHQTSQEGQPREEEPAQNESLLSRIKQSHSRELYKEVLTAEQQSAQDQMAPSQEHTQTEHTSVQDAEAASSVRPRHYHTATTALTLLCVEHCASERYYSTPTQPIVEEQIELSAIVQTEAEMVLEKLLDLRANLRTTEEENRQLHHQLEDQAAHTDVPSNAQQNEEEQPEQDMQDQDEQQQLRDELRQAQEVQELLQKQLKHAHDNQEHLRRELEHVRASEHQLHRTLHLVKEQNHALQKQLEQAQSAHGMQVQLPEPMDAEPYALHRLPEAPSAAAAQAVDNFGIEPNNLPPRVSASVENLAKQVDDRPPHEIAADGPLPLSTALSRASLLDLQPVLNALLITDEEIQQKTLEQQEKERQEQEEQERQRIHERQKQERLEMQFNQMASLAVDESVSRLSDAKHATSATLKKARSGDNFAIREQMERHRDNELQNLKQENDTLLTYVKALIGRIMECENAHIVLNTPPALPAVSRN